MKKIKKLMLIPSMLICLSVNIHAVDFQWVQSLSGSLTWDPSTWLEALTEVYNQYDELMNDVEIITSLYESLKLATEEAQNMSFDDLGWDNDFDIRNEIESGVSQINSKLNNVRRLRDKLNERSISIAGEKFSFTDLAGFDENGWERMADAVYDKMEKSKEKWTRIAEEGMTEEERQYVWSTYGLSPANYNMVRGMKHQYEMATKPVMEEVLELAEGIAPDEKEGKLFDFLMKIANNTGIPKVIQKIQTILQKNTAESVKTVAKNIDNLAGIVSLQEVVRRSEEEARREEEYRIKQKEKQTNNYEMNF